MKKRIFTMILCVLAPILASAQAQIVTRKMKFEDFTEKTTKVVLTGNLFFDNAFKEEVKNCWRISPYEFCSLEEFGRLKTDSDYYFLILLKNQSRKESCPGIEMLSVLKGGPEASKGIRNMLEVVGMPFRPADFPSGREIVFLPALLDIMQEQVLAAMEKDLDAYGGLATSNTRLSSSRDKVIVLVDTDLAEGAAGAVSEEKGRVLIKDEQDVDEILIGRESGYLVGYVVAPEADTEGFYCYKMLIDSDSHQLYYYKKHRMNKKDGRGFLGEDIKKIQFIK
ncbi:MAG: hypothetical protein ACI4TM_11370 [Candidatus Cryptobacteroides sp.]